MPSSFLPYGRQAIDDDDIAAVAAVLRSDYLTTGPAFAAFEDALSKRMDGAEVIACANGTAALHLTTMALGLGPGDWAIVPAITFLATANAVRYVGADVIFCDVDPKTGLMTPEILERAITDNPDKNIRAVFPVHLAGQPADPVGIAAIARREGIAVVEDACHALGTEYPGVNDGNLVPVGACADADMAIFSFHPVKTITCGEGGAVSTRDAVLAEKLRLFRSHGMTRNPADFENTDLAFGPDGEPNPWYYEMAELGYNYRLSDINAALGASQLRKLDTFIKARQRIVAHYDRALKDLAPVVQPNGRVPGCTVGWHLYPVRIDFDSIGLDRATTMNRLREAGVGTQVHYIPVPSQPYYRKLYSKQVFQGAETYYKQTLSLPLFPGLTDGDIDAVVHALANAVAGAR
jgi:UDP-4-amino-4,6-dideoxy-N-acetyl-beta-L-altrosamine transaminase